MPTEPVRRPLDTDLLCGLMQEVFAGGGTFRFYPTGGSMLPMLHEHRDCVELASPEGRTIKKYDVILYRRGSGEAVLHRILGIDRVGKFILCGDAQTERERGIDRAQVLGVLVSFTRDGKEIPVEKFSYRAYVLARASSRPFRALFKRGKRWLLRGKRG